MRAIKSSCALGKKERGAEGVDSQLKSGKTKKEKERGSCLKRGPGQS